MAIIMRTSWLCLSYGYPITLISCHDNVNNTSGNNFMTTGSLTFCGTPPLPSELSTQPSISWGQYGKQYFVANLGIVTSNYTDVPSYYNSEGLVFSIFYGHVLQLLNYGVGSDYVCAKSVHYPLWNRFSLNSDSGSDMTDKKD